MLFQEKKHRYITYKWATSEKRSINVFCNEPQYFEKIFPVPYMYERFVAIFNKYLVVKKTCLFRVFLLEQNLILQRYSL